MATWRKHLLFFLVAGLLASEGVWADVVGVLLSERGPSYAAVGDVVQSELERGGHVLTTSYASDGNAVEALQVRAPKVLITLGAVALRTVLASDVRSPVIAALIPRAVFERVMREPGRKSTGPVYGIYLDQPFGRQLDLLRLVQPDVRRVGVLWGPESVAQRPLLQAALASRGWTESAGVVGPDVTLGEATKRALDDADVLLAVADPVVFNSTTVSNVLMASYRAKLGVFAFSPAYVKAGAVAALYSAPAQIGAQTAEAARALLRGGSVAPAQYPNEFSVSVNEHVARSLGVSIDEATLLERLKRMERKP